MDVGKESGQGLLGRKVAPRVTIGMPVYNGEEYIAKTLVSLLGQTYPHFILHISDNASTDGTERICREFAGEDSRIVYERNTRNLGATKNFNKLVEAAHTEYFMWASHDDVWHRSYLERAVSALDGDPPAVLCYAATRVVDEDDQTIKSFAIASEFHSEHARVRFRRSLFYPPQSVVFGLLRTEALKRTRLLGNYSASDQVLAGELALRGRFVGIREHLFYYRRHKHQSTGVKFPTMHSRMAWFDPANRTRWTFPHWRLLAEHLRGVRASKMALVDRLAIYAAIARWAIRHRRHLVRNLVLADARLGAGVAASQLQR